VVVPGFLREARLRREDRLTRVAGFLVIPFFSLGVSPVEPLLGESSRLLNVERACLGFSDPWRIP
jgi:hypothetical protein